MASIDFNYHDSVGSSEKFEEIDLKKKKKSVSEAVNYQKMTEPGPFWPVICLKWPQHHQENTDTDLTVTFIHLQTFHFH